MARDHFIWRRAHTIWFVSHKYESERHTERIQYQTAYYDQSYTLRQPLERDIDMKHYIPEPCNINRSRYCFFSTLVNRGTLRIPNTKNRTKSMRLTGKYTRFYLKSAKLSREDWHLKTK